MKKNKKNIIEELNKTLEESFDRRKTYYVDWSKDKLYIDLPTKYDQFKPINDNPDMIAIISDCVSLLKPNQALTINIRYELNGYKFATYKQIANIIKKSVYLPIALEWKGLVNLCRILKHHITVLNRFNRYWDKDKIVK